MTKTEQWSTATEDRLAREVYAYGTDTADELGVVDLWPGFDADDAEVRDECHAAARRFLDVLADAGVLIPPDAPTRTEWASEHLGDLGQAGNRLFQPTGNSRASDTGERLARIRVETWRTDRPEVVSRLLRRTATTVYCEWEEVSE